MRAKLQLVMCSDEGHEETVTDVITLNKNSQRIEPLGLTLAEAKQLLSTLQRHLLQHQVDTFLDRCATCSDCGALLKVKAHASRSFRTLFGTYKVYSPRLEQLRLHTAQDLVIPAAVGAADRVGCSGAPLYGSQVVLSGVLWYEPGCSSGLLAT